MNAEEPDFSIKIVLTGNTGVGKTNFLSRFTDNQFNNDTKSTIGVQFASKMLEINGKTVKAQIWDTSGQEKFNTITTAYYRDSIGAILFYDITNNESFESVPHWLENLRKEVNDNCVLMLIGNKCDLEDQRKVTTEKGKEFAQKENLIFFESSALNATNVNEAFMKLLSEIVERLNSKKENEQEKNIENHETDKKEDENSQQKQNEQREKDEQENQQNQQNESQQDIKQSEKDEQYELQQDENSQQIDNQNCSSEMVHILIEKEKITEFIEYVRTLESKLSKFEEVSPFDFQSFMSSIVNEPNNERENKAETKDESIEVKEQKQIETQEREQKETGTIETVQKQSETGQKETKANEPEQKQTDFKEKVFIDDEDEKYQEIRNQIGEGSSSIAFKVVDTRNLHVMCKKILKAEDANSKTEDLAKEFEELRHIHHPCICQLISINLTEKVTSSNDKQTMKKEKNDEEEEYYESVISKPKKEQERTSISLFTEYLDFSLKSCLENDILTNTLKTKIALEIAFGMSHLHKLGMIHRDLRIDNIMLNSGFEAKIINFGLVHHGIAEMLTRDIGTLTYMSPEMQNEDDYDNKTDVYSYGVILYALFAGKLPKQKMKDKLNKVPPHFPKPSSSISIVCIQLIMKCMSFETKERPSFQNIIDYMYQNSFALADEVDLDIVSRRYHELINLVEK